MTSRKLLNSVSRLGLPMFEPNEELDVNETLAEVVKSLDTRLWEGFPVLLANVAESYQFAPEQVKQQLTRKEQKDHFHQLMLLSGSLFSLYHLSFSWWNKLKKGLSKEDKASIKTWRNYLVHNQTLKCNNVALDPERLKGLFELYFEKKAEKDRRRKEKYEEFDADNSDIVELPLSLTGA